MSGDIFTLSDSRTRQSNCLANNNCCNQAVTLKCPGEGRIKCYGEVSPMTQISGSENTQKLGSLGHTIRLNAAVNCSPAYFAREVLNANRLARSWPSSLSSGSNAIFMIITSRSQVFLTVK